MKHWLVLISSIAWSISCTTAFKRQGYDPKTLNTPAKPCSIAIKKNAQLPANPKLLGTISAGEPGMGMRCDINLVLTQFKEDGCALGANLVHIVSENRPDFWSTCYRAKAELLKVSHLLTTDPEYFPKNLSEQGTKDHQNGAAKVGGIFGGAVGAAVGSSLAAPEKQKK